MVLRCIFMLLDSLIYKDERLIFRNVIENEVFMFLVMSGKEPYIGKRGELIGG